MGETIAQHTSIIGLLALIAALVVILVLARIFAARATPPRPAPPKQGPLGVIHPQELDQKLDRVAEPAIASVSEPVPEPDSGSVLDVSALTAAIDEAETGGEPERLPALYLHLARRRLDAGEAAAAGDLLRKCIRAAAAAPHKAVHASARLLLGDIAYADGDLTTACEHWQIARAIFHELKDKRHHAQAESRMLSNGCPTDWVLTDF